MTVEHEVSVKDALGFVMHRLADQGELGEGMDVTVDTHRADQLDGQLSSPVDGHRVRGRRGGKGTRKGRWPFISVSECGDGSTRTAIRRRMRRRVKGDEWDPIRPGRRQSLAARRELIACFVQSTDARIARVSGGGRQAQARSEAGSTARRGRALQLSHPLSPRIHSTDDPRWLCFCDEADQPHRLRLPVSRSSPRLHPLFNMFDSDG